MGYEVEWVELPEAAGRARSRWEDCAGSGLVCDHEPRCAEAYFSLAEPFRFCLNVAGMAVCRDGMRRAAMSYRAERQPFPDWPFEGAEDWRSASRARRDAYRAAERAAAAQTVPGGVGVPEFKLSSNGPWIVGPQEIAGALGRYALAPAGLRAELEAAEVWRDWLGWLRETVTRGGFTVG
ncbi:hypothetical protein [Streptomyces sp. Y1]|uniref:Uncharacterized protein n=1 Tax=Streptomyces sp. Y1 TaxID=3238634 RepID=A0AB39TTK2_9ACTN